MFEMSRGSSSKLGILCTAIGWSRPTVSGCRLARPNFGCVPGVTSEHSFGTVPAGSSTPSLGAVAVGSTTPSCGLVGTTSSSGTELACMALARRRTTGWVLSISTFWMPWRSTGWVPSRSAAWGAWSTTGRVPLRSAVATDLSSSSFSHTAMYSASDARFSSCLDRSRSFSMVSRSSLTVALSSSVVLSRSADLELLPPPRRGEAPPPTGAADEEAEAHAWPASSSFPTRCVDAGSSCRGVNWEAVTWFQTMSAFDFRTGLDSNTAPRASEVACRL
mmetsp:Transcript_61858/g.191527  ORF Transcript_61858/g.191527 Transcript_61858/m.191527 type:complete len:276 (-) Transcript_61858:123-950(-)